MWTRILHEITLNKSNLQQIQLSSVPGRFTKKIWASKRLPSLPLVMWTCNEDGASVVCDTSAKWAKRCWSSGQMNCRKGKSFADAWAPEKRYLRKYHRAIHSICYLWSRIYIYIYINIHACRKMHTQSDLLISVRVIQEMGKYDHPFAEKVGQGWSHEADFSRIPFFVYVGVMNKPSTINHQLMHLGNLRFNFLGEANFDIFWSKQVNNGKHQQQCATTQCHLLPVTSSFKCNSSKMPREGSTICQWCVRRSQQSPEDIGPKPRPKAWLPNSISSVNRDKIWNGVKTKTPA